MARMSEGSHQHQFWCIKDVDLAETIQNTCSFNHSWQREGESLLKTHVVLCWRENRHSAPSTEEQYMAPPQSSWYHPNSPDFQCLRSAASLWFLPGGLNCGKSALCTLSVPGNSCNSRHINTFFTPSRFQLMCRWKRHRWSVGENPCLARDGVLLL